MASKKKTINDSKWNKEMVRNETYLHVLLARWQHSFINLNFSFSHSNYFEKRII